MTEPDAAIDKGSIATPIPVEVIAAAKKELEERCKASNITFEERGPVAGRSLFRIGMKCGRNIRWLNLWGSQVIQILTFQFDKYIFLSNLEAICSYADGTIEAGLRPVGIEYGVKNYNYRRFFGLDRQNGDSGGGPAKITIAATQEGLPHIEISTASEVYAFLSGSPSQITFKLTDCHVATHDAALALLNKVAGSVLFQLDLLTNVPMVIARERRHFRHEIPVRNRENPPIELQYPITEFHDAPLSLYWYARSATSMPLFQYLAYYQVLEFYFPIYSELEAHQKLRGILKDPTFRRDRDTDIARLLKVIRISRSGAYGDEQSQLRATLAKCVDADELRQYLEANSNRKDFFSAKSKATPYHKIPLANISADLRNDVADRVYDIRCRIVHTKTGSRDGDVELLLPFTQDADQLSYDIELVQYLAQRVLVAGGSPFNVHG